MKTYITKKLITEIKQKSESHEFDKFGVLIESIYNDLKKRRFGEGKEIVLYDIRSNVINLLTNDSVHFKIGCSLYYDLLPVLYRCCNCLKENFEMLFMDTKKQIRNWREAYHYLIN